MTQLLARRQFLISTGLAASAVCTSGCGTLLHQERVGQCRGGIDDLDWTVVGMNSIGLIFFFVPGVIAFAIDYYNGSLFYPTDCAPRTFSSEPQPLEQVTLPPGSPQQALQAAEVRLSLALGRPLDLNPSELVTRELTSIDQFWTTHQQLAKTVSCNGQPAHLSQTGEIKPG